MPSLFLFLPILVFLTILFLGLLVFFINPKGKANLFFLFLILASLWWIATNFVIDLSQVLKSALFFSRVAILGPLFIGPILLYFSLVFPVQKKKISFWSIFIIFFPLVLFLFFVPTKFNVEKVWQEEWGVSFKPGVLYYFLLFYLLVYFSIAFSNFLKSYHKEIETLKKTQILYVFIGLLLALIVGLFSSAILPIFGYSKFVTFGPSFSILLFTAFIAYAIIAKQLFSIKIVLTSLLVGTISFILLIQIFIIPSSIWRAFNIGIFILFCIFGYSLVKSVLREISYRERLAKAYGLEKKARKKIQELGEAKTQFIMATQHHLRTPLTSMRGYLDLIFGGTYGRVPEKLKETLLKFQVSNSRLIRIVNELLDISQFQLGKKVVVLEPNIQIEPILEEIIEELKFTAKTKGIYLKFEKPEETMPNIKADVEKLKVALFNIFDNAIKYTTKGGITIKLKTQNSKLKIVSQDTGIGITEEQFKTLFTGIFERGEEAKKVFTTGRGIGLYIASKIIQSHQGKVWAESEGKGKGSTFYVELPVG